MIDNITAAYENPRPGRSAVLVTTGATCLDQVNGFGPQVRPIIEVAHRSALDDMGRVIVSGWANDSQFRRVGDRVVWENGRVVALIRVLADGALAMIEFPATGYPVAMDASEIGGGR